MEETPCTDCNGTGHDGSGSCVVCEGKGYRSGEEMYLLGTYVCVECDEAQVEYLDAEDRFECLACGNEYQPTTIAQGGLEEAGDE